MRYQMSDGMVVDTDKSTQAWEEERFFDGSNQIGLFSGSQYTTATLYRSRRGRYYMVTLSAWQGQRELCEWVSREEAARFLLVNHYEIPEELSDVADEVTE